MVTESRNGLYKLSSSDQVPFFNRSTRRWISIKSVFAAVSSGRGGNGERALSASKARRMRGSMVMKAGCLKKIRRAILRARSDEHEPSRPPGRTVKIREVWQCERQAIGNPNELQSAGRASRDDVFPRR